MLYIAYDLCDFQRKLEIPEDGNDILDDVLDAKQFWHKVYTLSVDDFYMVNSNNIHQLE